MIFLYHPMPSVHDFLSEEKEKKCILYLIAFHLEKKPAKNPKGENEICINVTWLS